MSFYCRLAKRRCACIRRDLGVFGNEHEERAFNRCLKQLVFAASAVDEIDFRKKNLTGNSSPELERGPSPPQGKAKQSRGAEVRGKTFDSGSTEGTGLRSF
jgi:hypothetical protein